MAKFAYRGVPIRDAQGHVVVVQPVRGIVASDGATYPGVVGRDADGNAFTYNQVPSEQGPEPVEPKRFLTAEGFTFVTVDSRSFVVEVQNAGI